MPVRHLKPSCSSDDAVVVDCSDTSCLPPQPTDTPADNYVDGQGDITAYKQLRYSGQVTNFPRAPITIHPGSSPCQIVSTVLQTGGINAQLAIIQVDTFKLSTIDVSRNGPKSCPLSLKGSSSTSSDYRWGVQPRKAGRRTPALAAARALV